LNRYRNLRHVFEDFVLTSREFSSKITTRAHEPLQMIYRLGFTVLVQPQQAQTWLHLTSVSSRNWSNI
jgi:hypothetical protein